MKKLIFLIPVLIILFNLPSVMGTDPDIFNLPGDDYEYDEDFHLQTFRPETPNGIAIIFLPGGGIGDQSMEFNRYALDPHYPGEDYDLHKDYPPFINTLIDWGFIVVLPYTPVTPTEDPQKPIRHSQSIRKWKNFERDIPSC